MFLHRITLSLLCAAALTGCSGSTPGVPPGGPPITVPQLTSVTAFRDCAVLRVTDLVGMTDRLQAILTSADNLGALQALGIIVTPVVGQANTFDFQANFDLDGDGVDDSFSGRIAFSGDPAQLGPGDTAQVSWNYAAGSGAVTGSGDLDFTLTVDGATVSGMGTFMSTDGCEFNFMIPASDPLPIDFGLPAGTSARLGSGLEVQALNIGGVEIAGVLQISITIGGATYDGTLTFTAGSNDVVFNGELDGITVTITPVVIFGSGLSQVQVMGLIDAALLKLGLLRTIFEQGNEVLLVAFGAGATLPPGASVSSPFAGSVDYTLRLGTIPTNLPSVGDARNVTVTGTINDTGAMTWEITSDARAIEGQNTSGIPTILGGGVQGADGNITMRGLEGRICSLIFSNANLTFTGEGGIEGGITRFAVLFPGASQSSAADDSIFSAVLNFNGDSVDVSILALRVNGVSVYRDNPTAPRNFELTLN